jgi:uncharacterized membrane protein YfcA
MDLAYSLCGFLIGSLVGFTGIGGGSVMTPLLILVFGVQPLTAVGTDLLYAAVTKATGAKVHAYRSNVEWRVVGYLAMGSVPGALATIYMMTRLPIELTHLVTVAIGVALLLAAIGLLIGRSTEIETGLTDTRSAETSRDRSRMTVFLGFLLGVLVSLTSIGVGAIGIVVLRYLYPRLPAARLVGSDIAHAVPLTLIAGSGHWLIGDVNWTLLGSLLIGSIPGIILASCFTQRVPERVLRRTLGVVLLAVAAPMAAS